MWNPDSYRDTDYGLGEDERFEPTDSLEEEFVPSEGELYIQSVLGPIRPEESGVTLVREHLQWDGTDGIASRLDNVNAALVDLESFFSASGRTIVSAVTAGQGRDANRLLWLAQHAPVHIVAGTGFPARRDCQDRPEGGLTVAMEEEIERDITVGMDGTACRAGVLLLTCDDPDNHDAREATALVADASRKHDLAIFAEATDRRGAIALVRRLVNEGADPGKIVFTFDGLESDPAAALELTGDGVSVLFGRLGADDHPVAASIVALVRAGHHDSILLSHGFNRRSQLSGYGGRPGLGYVVEHFAVMLLEAGLEAQDVRAILVDNAAKVLSKRRRA